MALAACSREGVLPADDVLSPKTDGPARSNEIVKQLVFTGIQEGDPATRTTLDSDGTTVLWKPGDQINIFHEGCDPACFINTETENTAIATFDGSITTHIITGGSEGSGLDARYYWGLYPYDADATYADGAITTTLPAVQTAAEGTFADGLFITVGRSLSASMPFYNVCSGIKFSLDRSDIRTVTFTADGGQSIAGKFSVGFDDDSGKPAVREILEGASSIVVNAPDGGCFNAGVWYYVVTLPQTLENADGFTFTFTMQGDEDAAPIRMRSTATLPLNRSAFRKTAMKINTAISTDIETSAVRSFLEDSEIDAFYTADTEYTQSLKGSGVSSTPNPVTLTWAATGERTLYLSTSEDFSDATAVSVGASSASTSIYNLIPGVTYYCRTVSANGATYWETSFVPVGPFRALSVSGASNARDLGGWTTTDGKKVRYGKLFRGAAPSSLSTELLQLGAAVEMDLRGYPNTSGNAAIESPFGAEFINRPVCQFMYPESSSSSGPGGGSSTATPGVSADDYQQAIREIIGYLQEGKGVYFHCIGGKDRTGTLSWLILSLLGVDEADLCKEYELTSDRTRENDSSRPFKQLVFYIKTFTSYDDPDTGETLEAASLQDMTTFWALTKQPEESDYLGPFDPLTRDEIQALKDLLLED